MPKQAVLLVGASIRWAARSATDAGHRVIGMDLFGDQDTRVHCERFEPITPPMCVDGSRLREAIARLAEQEHAVVARVGGLQAISADAIEWHRLRQLAADSGFGFPESYGTCPAIEHDPGHWLFKKNESTAGLGVQFAGSRETGQPGIWQRRIPGQSFGLVALAQRERVSLLGMTRSIHVRHGSLPFVYAGSRTISLDDSFPSDLMRSLAETIAHQRNLRGLFNLDWIRDWQNRWWLLEVNERPSASCEVLERAARYRSDRPLAGSLMALHLDAMNDRDCNNRFAPIGSNAHPSVHVKRIVYSRINGMVDLSGLPARWRSDQADASRDSKTLRIHIADRPASGTPVLKNQPIATVLIDAPNSTLALSRLLRDVVGKVRDCVTS